MVDGGGVVAEEADGGGAVLRLMRWSRTDQVSLEGLLWAAPALAVVSLGVSVVRAVRDAPLEVTGELPGALVRPAEAVVGPVSGTVVLPDPTAGQHVLALAPEVVLVVAVLSAAWLLLGIARGLRLGDPFTRANARRLNLLAVLVGVGGVLLQLVDGVARGRLLEAALPGTPGLTLTLDLALWPLPVVLLLAFLAEVFSRGARLREDVEGLV